RGGCGEGPGNGGARKAGRSGLHLRRPADPDRGPGQRAGGDEERAALHGARADAALHLAGRAAEHGEDEPDAPGRTGWRALAVDPLVAQPRADDRGRPQVGLTSSLAALRFSAAEPSPAHPSGWWLSATRFPSGSRT